MKILFNSSQHSIIYCATFFAINKLPIKTCLSKIETYSLKPGYSRCFGNQLTVQIDKRKSMYRWID